jgi:hypothetical protein
MEIDVGNVGQPIGQPLKKKMCRCLIISDLRTPSVVPTGIEPVSKV